MNENNTNDLFLKYNKALEILQDKFNKLNMEYVKLGDGNPIEHIKFRIKSEDSIKKKLEKKNLEYNAFNIENNLKDVVGIRIICSFLSDLKNLIQYIQNDPELEIINIKDYVNNPKESGYSSYHIIVMVDVLIDNHIEKVPAEIQLRTMAMDVWASLDHKIRYKKDKALNENGEISLQMTNDFMNVIDKTLDNINNEKSQKLITKTTSIPQFCSNNELHLFLYKYIIALNTVENKLNSIKNLYTTNGLVNPIEHIKSRIKPLDAMITKLESRYQPLSLDNLEKYINDIGAIKIVCSFLSDANVIIDLINNQKDFTIIDRQDYIRYPKNNGYSSYHFVVLVPVTLNNKTTNVKIEIQVRTINMELWANLEHKLCYKKMTNDETRLKLKKISEILRIIDTKLDLINLENKIQNPSLKK